MSTIYNSDLTKELVEGAKIQTSKDSIPSQLADKVVPVMEVNPRLLRRINFTKDGTASNATTATIFTTPTDKDFFITNAMLTWVKDVTATSLSSFITAFIDGVNRPILTIGGFTLTPLNDTVTITFNTPIKVDRNTNIAVTNSTNVANTKATGIIYGYFVYNANA